MKGTQSVSDQAEIAEREQAVQSTERSLQCSVISISSKAIPPCSEPDLCTIYLGRYWTGRGEILDV